MMAVPQIVIDTNVLVSALRSRLGAAHRLLLLIDSGRFEFCLCVPLLLEYEDVCKRLVEEINLTEQAIDDILDYVCKKANQVTVFYLWRPVLRDPSDDMVLELAIAAECDAIVTFNKRHFRGAEKFGVHIQTPKEFLTQIGALP